MYCDEITLYHDKACKWHAGSLKLKPFIDFLQASDWMHRLKITDKSSFLDKILSWKYSWPFNAKQIRIIALFWTALNLYKNHAKL